MSEWCLVFVADFLLLRLRWNATLSDTRDSVFDIYFFLCVTTRKNDIRHSTFFPPHSTQNPLSRLMYVYTSKTLSPSSGTAERNEFIINFYSSSSRDVESFTRSIKLKAELEFVCFRFLSHQLFSLSPRKTRTNCYQNETFATRPWRQRICLDFWKTLEILLRFARIIKSFRSTRYNFSIIRVITAMKAWAIIYTAGNKSEKEKSLN